MSSAETLASLEFDRVRRIAASLAASSLGEARLLALAPLPTAAEAEHMAMLTGELVSLLVVADFPLHGLVDVREVLRQASVPGASLDPEALYAVALTARTGDNVRNFLIAHRQQAPLLNEQAKAIANQSKLAAAIEKAIGPDGEILDEASSNLKHLRGESRKEAKALESRMNGILQKWSSQGVLQDAVVSYRDGRLALPVKDEYRHRVQGVIVDTSASGSTVFLEPVETLELSNRIRQLEAEERREIHRILLDLTAQVHRQLDELRAMLDILAGLDELYGRAKLALRWDGVAVALNDNGHVRILRGRHPLLIERLKSKVIPLSFELLPPKRTIVISGPNAGGKTVVLKTVGIFALMASAGLFVPAAPGTELPFFAGVHADIGDAQSIESDLSTFTAHLGRLQRMVNDPAQPKLVLVDEIGASTDPALGAALAQAVLLELTRQGAITLVTTHHGALKAFAHETAGIENGSMAFDEASLEPTYHYRPGVPGSSYALEIAERVGFPAQILETARSFLGTGQLGLEELVSALSRKIEEYEKLRRESDIKLTEYAALQQLYAEKTKELKKAQAEVKAKAIAEAEAMIERTGRDMEAAIKELKKEQASKAAIQAARERIIAAHEEVEQKRAVVKQELAVDEPVRKRVTNPVVGQRVEIEDLNGIATIINLQRNGARVEVEIGGLRMWTDTRKLFEPHASDKQAKPARVDLNIQLDRGHVSMELDLRGKYGDEAIPELDSYLAAAADVGYKQVNIIHGKGTGALRVKVRDFLNSHPLVKSFHDGGRNRDDFGSTIVELSL
jgi:DNA mismatch repair protein MutS2